MKQTINIFLITILLAAVAVTGLSAVAQTTPATNTNASFTSCQPELKTFLDKESKEYEAFLQQHLQSKKATADLIDIANQKFLQYQAKLINKRTRLSFGQTHNRDEALNDVQVCQQIIDKYLLAAENFQRSMIIANAQRKSTIRLAERMRDINTKLNTLNREVGTINGYLKVFSQKVPCYVSNCPPL
ncbi:hypothetical protein KKG71_02245 [Patescibacteria group bacterium]|nr:hypothetical protein [Patescibacteria group bacterium]